MNFQKQIGRFNDKADRKFQQAFRQSVQEVVNRSREPIAKGGRMPVDTGFLRASGGSGVNQMPSGPTENEGGGPVTSRVTGMGLTEALGRWKPGDTFFFGFSSSYSRFMEYRYGFVRGAAEKWGSIVKSVARRL